MLLLGIIRRWPAASCHKVPVTPMLCLAMQIKLFPIPQCDLSVVDASPKETPEEEKYDDRRNACNRAVLFE